MCRLFSKLQGISTQYLAHLFHYAFHVKHSNVTIGQLEEWQNYELLNLITPSQHTSLAWLHITDNATQHKRKVCIIPRPPPGFHLYKTRPNNAGWFFLQGWNFTFRQNFNDIWWSWVYPKWTTLLWLSKILQIVRLFSLKYLSNTNYC